MANKTQIRRMTEDLLVALGDDFIPDDADAFSNFIVHLIETGWWGSTREVQTAWSFFLAGSTYRTEDEE